MGSFNIMKPAFYPEDGQDFIVTEPGWFEGSKGDAWILPVGFVTDFASVPAAFRWLFNVLGVYTVLAAFHDLWCRIAAGDIIAIKPGLPNPSGLPTLLSRRDADELFYLGLRDLGVRKGATLLMWAAVRWGGYLAGGIRPGELACLLAVTVAALPLLAIAAVLQVVRLLLRALRVI